MARRIGYALIGLLTVASACCMLHETTADAQQPQVSLSLNLFYNDPADPTEGGTWSLVAKTDDADGIASIVAYLGNAGTPGSSSMNTGIGALAAVGSPPGPPFSLLETTKLQLIYAQDMTSANTVARVGAGDGPPSPDGAPGEIFTDPLRNSVWHGASLIGDA